MGTLAAVTVAGCHDLTTTPLLRVKLTPDSAANAIPNSMWDSQSLHVIVRLADQNSGQGLFTTNAHWRSSNDSIISIVQGPACDSAYSARKAETRACLFAKMIGNDTITLVIDQPGFESAQTTFTIQVKERWIDVAAGSSSTCAINVHQQIYCWGFALSLGTITRPAALTVPGVQFQRLFAGSLTFCALIRQPAVPYCWGSNLYGVGGLGPGVLLSYLPTQMVSATPMSAIAIADSGALGVGDFGCGITTARAVSCWGHLRNLNLGFSFLGQKQCDQPLIAFGEMCVYQPGFWLAPDSGLIKTSSSIAVGSSHACAVMIGDVPSLQCWGNDSLAQLGNGSTSAPSLFSSVSNLRGLAGDSGAVAAGGNHSCAVFAKTGADGPAYCWGENDYGEAGAWGGGAGCPKRDPSANAHCIVATPLLLPMRFASIVAGLDFSCGLTTAGAAYCWGNNQSGQLGASSPSATCLSGSSCSDTPLPVKLDSGRTFTFLSAGTAYACGITRPDGAIFCWGTNASGQLGDGTQTKQTTPVRVAEPDSRITAQTTSQVTRAPVRPRVISPHPRP